MSPKIRRVLILTIAAVGGVAAVATSAPYDFLSLSVAGPTFEIDGTTPRAYAIVVCSPEPYRDTGFFRVGGLLRDADVEPEVMVTGRIGEGSGSMRLGDGEVALSSEPASIRHEFELRAEEDGRFCSDPIEVMFSSSGGAVKIRWGIVAEVYADLDGADVPLTVQVHE